MLLALLTIAGCATFRGPALTGIEPAPIAPENPEAFGTHSWALVNQAAMPSVVLLLAETDSGELTYGSGIVVETSQVLTNHHLVHGVRRIDVLPWGPERVSYAPFEGGVQRLVFQHQDELLPATLVGADPVLDLALLQVAGLVDAVPLPVRDTPLQSGEPVLALGHPRQSVWSSTAGVVSALHQGLIQHDAPLNQGNSGGPLVDARGRLVGVNTLELTGGAEGMAYARPIELARPLLEGGQRALRLDFTEPDTAHLSCEQAVDLAPWQALDCIWWDGEHQRLLAAAARVRADLELPEEVDGRLERQIRLHSREAWIGGWQLQVVQFLSGGVIEASQTLVQDIDYDGIWSDPADRTERADAQQSALSKRRDELRDQEQAYAQERATRGGPAEDLGPSAARDARALGQRLVELYLPTERMALMHIEAHAPDGALYGYTECWVLVPGGWRQRMSCPPAYTRLIPPDWPLPLNDHALMEERFEIGLEAAILGVELEGDGAN